MQKNPKYALKFLDVLRKFSIDYALIGGVAIGFWCTERFTKDFDFTIALDKASWSKLEAYLKKSKEITTDLIAKDKEASLDLPYLIRIKYQDEPIDLIVALTEYQRVLLQRKVSVKLAGKKIFIASPEDIIISKLIAKRSQDLVDIENLLQHLSNLDMSYIGKWAQEWEVAELWKKILTQGLYKK